jgi:hypothetical protein
MNGSQLAFVANGSKELTGSTPTTFELSLADVSAVTAGVRPATEAARLTP